MAVRSPIGYFPAMSFVLRNLARYAAKKLASNPQVREAASKAAHVAADEAREIASLPVQLDFVAVVSVHVWRLKSPNLAMADEHDRHAFVA